jgi:hypothetical protein
LLICLDNRNCRRAHRMVVKLFLLFLTGSVAVGFGQTKFTFTKNERDDVASLKQGLLHSTQQVVDTILQGHRKYLESLTTTTFTASKKFREQIALLVDSLVTAAQDSLDAPRRDSLRLTAASLAQQFSSHESLSNKLFLSTISTFTQTLTRARGEFSRCTECEGRADFEGRLADFRDFVDSLSSGFRDSATSLMEDRMDILNDTYENVRDSLLDFRDGLIDNRLGDIDFWRYNSTRLVISSGYANHNSYRGRDNGIVQQAYAPSVMFRHSSGLSLQASTCWLTNEAKSWDNFQLTAGYDVRIGEVVGASLGYTHFWFSDSSRSEISVFTDNAQAGLSFDWPAVSISALGSMNFGAANEITLISSISHDFVLLLSLYNQITIEPTLSAVIGQQNSKLTTLRTTKVKGKKGATITTSLSQTASSFSILDYEASLPVTIEVGPFTFVPSATYIIPFNVVGVSSKSPFFDIDVTISLTIR